MELASGINFPKFLSNLIHLVERNAHAEVCTLYSVHNVELKKIRLKFVFHHINHLKKFAVVACLLSPVISSS